MKKVNDSFDRIFAKKINLYDDSLTGKTWYHRLYNIILWNEKNLYRTANIVLNMIPEDFSGRLLDVPAGTGVFTAHTYLNLENAHIDCLDYSKSMLRRYQDRIKNENSKNIHFKRGDVGKLPFSDSVYDIVLSMNGIQCFPEKEKALFEIKRVLKRGGKFIGCTYIRGVSKRTDFFVKNIYDRKGIFMPPHKTSEEFKKMLQADYEIQEYILIGSCACFKCCRK